MLRIYFFPVKQKKKDAQWADSCFSVMFPHTDTCSPGNIQVILLEAMVLLAFSGKVYVDT